MPSVFGTAAIASAPSLDRIVLLVERRAGQGARVRAGGDDHVPGGQRLGLGAGDRDLPRAALALAARTSRGRGRR